MKHFKLIASTLFLALTAPQINAQLKVTTGGSVAIGGNFTAAQKLHVLGNGLFSTSTSFTFAPMIRATTTTTSATTPDFTWSGDDNTGIFHPYQEELGFTTNGTERIKIDPYKVLFRNLAYGIEINSLGNWAPNYRVNSISTTTDYGFIMRYNSVDNFYVMGSGWVYAAGAWYGSDESFKRNIKTISDPLNKILALRGVTYMSNVADAEGNLEDRTYMGVVAQEVERIVPEVVTTNKDGKKAVAYANLVGLLIEGFKEQNEKIIELEKQIANCNTNNQTNNTSTSNSEITQSKSNSKLLQNNPNPFTTETVIKYSIPETTENAQIMIFDMQGQFIKSISLNTKGESFITISGNSLNPGMYIYSLIVNGSEVDSKRMILTK